MPTREPILERRHKPTPVSLCLTRTFIRSVDATAGRRLWHFKPKLFSRPKAGRFLLHLARATLVAGKEKRLSLQQPNCEPSRRGGAL